MSWKTEFNAVRRNWRLRPRGGSLWSPNSIGASRAADNFEGRQFEYIAHDDGTTTLKITAPQDLIATIVSAVDHVVASSEREAELSVSQRRVDALLRISSQVLEPDTTAPVGATIVIHTEAAERDSTQINDVSAETPPARLHGLPISRAAYERLRCGAKVATEHTRSNGTIERTPTADAIPRAVRRAVMRRDCGQCRWPGCTSKYRVEVHHLVYQSNGGGHDLGNLACLCAVHHHAVHDRGWKMEGDANRALTCTSPRGRIATEHAPEIVIEPADRTALAKRHATRQLTAATIATATNEPVDLAWVVGAICDNVHTRAQVAKAS